MSVQTMQATAAMKVMKNLVLALQPQYFNVILILILVDNERVDE